MLDKLYLRIFFLGIIRGNDGAACEEASGNRQDHRQCELKTGSLLEVLRAIAPSVAPDSKQESGCNLMDCGFEMRSGYDVGITTSHLTVEGRTDSDGRGRILYEGFMQVRCCENNIKTTIYPSDINNQPQLEQQPSKLRLKPSESSANVMFNSRTPRPLITHQERPDKSRLTSHASISSSGSAAH
ncbi:uncharacterized protein LOC123318394 [Coccinella septempunctata]|uniref:uncharacterized protein LOC123318394 n=1 Tax=Coccinella septempunctata TaxID=41139 RepID=UPI001D07AC81|nr:uncharacterized protein LOC123318394 [Coccinella septempunctata]